MTAPSDSLITCPHCGQSFALNEAVLNQHRAEIEHQFHAREQAAQKALAEREAKLQAAATALDQRAQAVQSEVARTLDAERQKIADAARKQAADAERLNLAQKEKVITDLQDQIALLKQKAEQGSTLGCTASLYGSVQGIAGAAALPDIAPLALPDGS